MQASGFVDIIRNNEIVLSFNYKPAYVRLPDFLKGQIVRAEFDGNDLTISTKDFGDLICRVTLTYFAYDQSFYTTISNWYKSKENLYNNLKLNQLESLNPPIKDGDSYFALRYDTTVNNADSEDRVTILLSYAGYLTDAILFINDEKVRDSFGTRFYNYLNYRFPDISWDTLNYQGKVALGGGDKII